MQVNGHEITETGETERSSAGVLKRYRCEGCGAVATRDSFAAGLPGCTGDPGSIVVSVCVGGERCGGHMVTDSAEFRSWHARTVDADAVPTYRHEAGDLAERAATEWVVYADRVGLKLSLWTQAGYRVGPEGGKVAELTHQGKPWHVRVSAFGKVTAHPGN